MKDIFGYFITSFPTETSHTKTCVSNGLKYISIVDYVTCTVIQNENAGCLLSACEFSSQ